MILSPLPLQSLCRGALARMTRSPASQKKSWDSKGGIYCVFVITLFSCKSHNKAKNVTPTQNEKLFAIISIASLTTSIQSSNSPTNLTLSSAR